MLSTVTQIHSWRVAQAVHEKRKHDVVKCLAHAHSYMYKQWKEATCFKAHSTHSVLLTHTQIHPFLITSTPFIQEFSPIL